MNVVIFWDRTKHVNSLCGQKAEFFYAKHFCIQNEHWALKGFIIMKQGSLGERQCGIAPVNVNVTFS